MGATEARGMSEPPVERRFQRVPFDGDVRVYTGSAMAGTRLIDISLQRLRMLHFL